MKIVDEIRREEETPQVRIINPEIDKEMFDTMRAEDALSDETAGTIAKLEAWLLKDDNEYVTKTWVTTTYCQKHINVNAVVDFLHDRIEIPKGAI
jgi:hypothetical protein